MKGKVRPCEPRVTRKTHSRTQLSQLETKMKIEILPREREPKYDRWRCHGNVEAECLPVRVLPRLRLLRHPQPGTRHDPADRVLSGQHPERFHDGTAGRRAAG